LQVNLVAIPAHGKTETQEQIVFRAARTGSSTLWFLRTRGLDDPVDIARAELIRSLAPRFLPDYPEHFQLASNSRLVRAAI